MAQATPSTLCQIMLPGRRIAGVVLASALLLAAGCNSGGGSSNGSEEPPPTSPAPPDPAPPDPPPDPDPPDPDPPQETAGLDARPSNTTCIAPTRATGSTTIGVERVFPNIRFADASGVSRNPVLMLQAPGDRSRWFVVERFGAVRVFENNPSVTTYSTFLDIGARVESSCAECGLLGMAFHPDFPDTPRAYLVYTTLERDGGGPNTHLSEFTSPDGGLTLNPASERVILTIHKASVHHHGGHVAFGPDGYLYFATGDGNSARRNDAQDLQTLLGKVLRIDIRTETGAVPYSIPSDNPFAASTAFCNAGGTGPQRCPEIWAWGLRNPWRWSFDRQTGELWAADVGESEIEEVNRIARGGNYGWRCFEGTQETGRGCGTPVGTMLPPVAEYSHELGRAVTGGYVYRGSAIPGLVGRYIFGDFVSGQLWHIPADTAPTLTMAEGLDSGLNISSFAEDLDGEVYVVNMRGTLHRITGSTSGGGTGVATNLSATGCVDPANPRSPASGLIPYEPTAPFWSDGVSKQRWIALPDGQNIVVGSDGDWDFPNGTVLMKNFSLGDRLIETRLFMRHPDGVWAGYSYEWNAQQTDATLVRGGKRVSVGPQEWIYPSEAQCMQCHTEAAGRSLGLETRQLASSITYPQTGRTAHQLVTLNAINVLSPPLADPAAETPYPNPTGTSGTLTERARAYLHTNCSQCHRPNGPTPSNMDLRYSTALANTNACDVEPGLGDLGMANARLIAPGAADRSVIPARMNLRDDPNAMPPNGLGAQVDTQGVALIREWIDSLTSCN
jgi:uncharacterized repeat protein (TIGR03806 family)